MVSSKKYGIVCSEDHAEMCGPFIMFETIGGKSNNLFLFEPNICVNQIYGAKRALMSETFYGCTGKND